MTAHLVKLRDELQQLELESALEISRWCNAATRAGNLTILTDQEEEESGSNECQQNKEKCPVSCKLNLTPAFEEGAFLDGGALAVDVMCLGLFPDVMHKLVDNVVKKAVRETQSPEAKDTMRKKLTASWKRLQATVFCKAECPQKVVREALKTRTETLTKEEKERRNNPNQQMKRMTQRLQKHPKQTRKQQRKAKEQHQQSHVQVSAVR